MHGNALLPFSFALPPGIAVLVSLFLMLAGLGASPAGSGPFLLSEMQVIIYNSTPRLRESTSR